MVGSLGITAFYVFTLAAGIQADSSYSEVSTGPDGDTVGNIYVDLPAKSYYKLQFRFRGNPDQNPYGTGKKTTNLIKFNPSENFVPQDEVFNIKPVPRKPTKNVNPPKKFSQQKYAKLQTKASGNGGSRPLSLRYKLLSSSQPVPAPQVSFYPVQPKEVREPEINDVELEEEEYVITTPAPVEYSPSTPDPIQYSPSTLAPVKYAASTLPPVEYSPSTTPAPSTPAAVQLNYSPSSPAPVKYSTPAPEPKEIITLAPSQNYYSYPRSSASPSVESSAYPSSAAAPVLRLTYKQIPFEQVGGPVGSVETSVPVVQEEEINTNVVYTSENYFTQPQIKINKPIRKYGFTLIGKKDQKSEKLQKEIQTEVLDIDADVEDDDVIELDNLSAPLDLIEDDIQLSPELTEELADQEEVRRIRRRPFTRISRRINKNFFGAAGPLPGLRYQTTF